MCIQVNTSQQNLYLVQPLPFFLPIIYLSPSFTFLLLPSFSQPSQTCPFHDCPFVSLGCCHLTWVTFKASPLPPALPLQPIPDSLFNAYLTKSFLALNISKDFQGILNSNHLVNSQTLRTKEC